MHRSVGTTRSTAVHHQGDDDRDLPGPDVRRRAATASMMKISSGAYATEDSASLANTGNAIRLGSRVSPSCALCSLRPTRIRFDTSPTPTAVRLGHGDAARNRHPERPWARSGRRPDQSVRSSTTVSSVAVDGARRSCCACGVCQTFARAPRNAVAAASSSKARSTCTRCGSPESRVIRYERTPPSLRRLSYLSNASFRPVEVADCVVDVQGVHAASVRPATRCRTSPTSGISGRCRRPRWHAP